MLRCGSDDLISRQEAIEWVEYITKVDKYYHPYAKSCNVPIDEVIDRLKQLPPAEPTIYGYNIEHLELIARVLQKEDLPPERIEEVLTDIGRIVAIVKDEFEEALRKAFPC